MIKHITDLTLALLLSATCLPLAARPNALDITIEALRTDPRSKAAAQQTIEDLRKDLGNTLLASFGTLMYIGEKCNYYVDGEAELQAFISAIAKDQTQKLEFLRIYRRAKKGETAIAEQGLSWGRIKYEYGIRTCNRAFVEEIQEVRLKELLEAIDYQEMQLMAEALKSLSE
jgi:hypothetical protein